MIEPTLIGKVLPRRTNCYLANGATEGQRNRELMAAACQIRDAGCEVSAAERILLPRALSDGLTNGEVISTVRSVFRRPPREPITPNRVSNKISQRRITVEEQYRIQVQRMERRLAARASASQKEILAKHVCGVAHYASRWPAGNIHHDPRNDWRLILKLFKSDDVVWIGQKKYESANENHSPEWIQHCRTRFRSASEWLNQNDCPGILICPNPFKPVSHSRRDGEVLSRRFLVLESDTLSKDQVCAVFKWAEQFTKLRAIVDTGGKSLHGWFDMPSPDVLAQFEIILPQLGCDAAMFTPSQPCRLPGANRPETGRIQRLVYLNVEGKL